MYQATTVELGTDPVRIIEADRDGLSYVVRNVSDDTVLVGGEDDDLAVDGFPIEAGESLSDTINTGDHLWGIAAGTTPQEVKALRSGVE